MSRVYTFVDRKIDSKNTEITLIGLSKAALVANMQSLKYPLQQIIALA